MSGALSLSRGETGAALPPQWGQPEPRFFQLLGSPRDQTTARSSCLAQDQHLPRLLGPLGSSMGGAIGDTLSSGARALPPFEPKPAQMLYSASWVPVAKYPRQGQRGALHCLPHQQRAGGKATSVAGRPGTSASLHRFVPRHADELELEVDDPLLVEVQAEDYWYEAYNMRTGDRGIFPAYYAIEVTKDPDHVTGTKPLHAAC